MSLPPYVGWRVCAAVVSARVRAGRRARAARRPRAARARASTAAAARCADATKDVADTPDPWAPALTMPPHVPATPNNPGRQSEVFHEQHYTGVKRYIDFTTVSISSQLYALNRI